MEAAQEPEQGIEEAPELGADVVYVTFCAEINLESAECLLETLGACASESVKEVRLLLTTFGGNVSAGISLYNVLSGLPYRLVTHNTGVVASIGVAVFLAGEERLACPNASFVTHGVTNTPPPGQAFGAKWFKERHDGILADEEKTNGILVERTLLTAEQLAGLSENEQTKDANIAVDEGIAHRIEDVKIPEGMPVLTVPTR